MRPVLQRVHEPRHLIGCIEYLRRDSHAATRCQILPNHVVDADILLKALLQDRGIIDRGLADTPRDNFMGDMNGDGRVDRDDAQWLASFIDDMSRRGLFGPRIGGLGVYGRTSAHGPFVHVDVRGMKTRW